MEPKFLHLDANESVFFARELEFIKSRSYDKKYADIKARALIPISNEADAWADAIVYESYDQVGFAKMIAGYSDDLPRADVAGTQFINPVKSLGASYAYNVMEIRKSTARNKNLPQRKANAAKRAILQYENTLAFLGDTATGLKGFLNHPNIPTVTIPNDGTGATITWSTKTPAQILRDMHLIANTVVSQSKGVEKPDTLLLPIDSFLLVSSTPWSTSNDGKTILAVFLEQNQYIKNVDWLNELTTAGAGSTKRMIAYRRDPEALTMEIPQDFEQFDPQPRNLEFVVPCHSRFGGVLMYYPLSAARGDGI